MLVSYTLCSCALERIDDLVVLLKFSEHIYTIVNKALLNEHIKQFDEPYLTKTFFLGQTLKQYLLLLQKYYTTSLASGTTVYRWFG